MSRYYRDPTTGNEIPIAGMRDLQDVKNLMLELCYPIGSMYMSTVNVSPATFLGGTWVSKSGYVLRGATSGVNFNSDTNDGGADSVTVSSVASHNHTQNAHNHDIGMKSDGGVISGNAGGYVYELHAQTWSLGRTDSGGHIYGRAGTGGGVTNNTTATNIENGSNYTVNTLPKYKNVYIWERTA